MVTSVSVSFEFYEQFVGKDLDRNECALHGSHKIGIASNVYNPRTKKKYFIGLSSTYHQTYHRRSSFLFGNKENDDINKNNKKYEQKGVLFSVDIDGRKKPVPNGIALRKFEIITMKLDWINQLLIFKRQRQNTGIYNGENDLDEKLICIPLKSNINSSSMDVTNMEWYPCCSLCLNQTDSFMWNTEEGQEDYIRITMLPGDIL